MKFRIYDKTGDALTTPCVQFYNEDTDQVWDNDSKSWKATSDATQSNTLVSLGTKNAITNCFSVDVPPTDGNTLTALLFNDSEVATVKAVWKLNIARKLQYDPAYFPVRA